MRSQRLAALTLPDYVPKKGRHDDWGFDPEEQRTRTYLGMGEEDINLHDQWAVESMGAIQDRTREHLGTSDKVIMANRRHAAEGHRHRCSRRAPPMALIRRRRGLHGPDTIDCIAPAPGWEAFWQQAQAAKRDAAAPWLRPAPAEAAGMSFAPLRRARRRARGRLRRGCCARAEHVRAGAHRPGPTCTAAARQDADAFGGAARRRCTSGVGMVSTLLLKDTSDRTAFKVFEPGGAGLPGFGFGAANLLLLPDPASLALPWAPGTAWLRAEPWFADGTPVPVDPRRVLQRALAVLAAAASALRCGLEVEFHIYRITASAGPGRRGLAGRTAAVALLHPGYQLLSEAWADRAHEALASCAAPRRAWACRCARWRSNSARASSRPSSTAADALTAADQMVLFRNGVRQALRRAGYHASFVCRPPFQRMASGWHLHQSLVHADDGRNAFMPEAGAGRHRSATPAARAVGDAGAHWLAGLLAHAHGMAAFGTAHVNAFGRFRPARWRRSRRCGGATTAAPCCAWWAARGAAAHREPHGRAAGQPLPGYIASQICRAGRHARRLEPPPATDRPMPRARPRCRPAGRGAGRAGRPAACCSKAWASPWRASSMPSSGRSWRATPRPKTRRCGSGANISAALDIFTRSAAALRT
jgi:glutamine synthetase